jgi:hypothetical protein
MASKAQSIQFLLSQVRASGVALSGGTVDFYSAGSTTVRKAVWLDRSKITQAANPYTLDSNATAQLYGDGLYRIIIKDALGVTKFDRDNQSFRDATGAAYALEDYADLAAAVTAIGATPATLQYSENFTLSDNLTIPANIEMERINGAIITVASGKTLTFADGRKINAEPSQMFSGSGLIRWTLPPAVIYPEMWGITGTADDVAIQKAIDSFGDTTKIRTGRILLTQGYNVAATILIHRKAIIFEGLGNGVLADSSATYLKWTGTAGIPMLKVQGCRGLSIKKMRLIGNITNKPSAAINLSEETSDLNQNAYHQIEDIWIGFYDFADAGENTNMAFPQFQYGIYLSGDNGGNNYHTFRNIRIAMCNTGVAIGSNQYGENTFRDLFVSYCTIGFYTNAAPADGYHWFFDNNVQTDIQIVGDGRLQLYGYASEASGAMAQIPNGRLTVMGGTFSANGVDASHPTQPFQGYVIDGRGGDPVVVNLSSFAFFINVDAPYVGSPLFSFTSTFGQDMKSFTGRALRGVTAAMIDMNTNAGNATSWRNLDLEVINSYPNTDASVIIKNMFIGPDQTLSASRYDVSLTLNMQKGLTHKINTLEDTTTPTVANGNKWVAFYPQTITAFDDGVIGQEIEILAESNTTIVHSGTLQLSGGADFVMTSGRVLRLFRRDATTWRELSRQ